MTFVVGIFQPTDDRCSRAHELGQFTLAEARFCTQRGNLAGHVVVGARSFKRSETARLAFVIPAMDDGDCIRSGFPFALRHVRPLGMYVLSGSFQTSSFARSLRLYRGTVRPAL